MNCVAHQSSGMWRHPDDQSWRYKDLRYWTELAKLLERGTFDGIFIADVLGTYDVYGGSNEAAIRHGAQVPVNDPVLLISAMALVTDNLGFGVTAGTAYEHPYPFARRMSTLDHLTNGRVGWNVVTGYLPSAARNMGNEDQLEHDDRYDHADEYLRCCTSCGKGPGRMTRSSATASPECSPTRAKCTRSATMASTSRFRASIFPSRRCSARR